MSKEKKTVPATEPQAGITQEPVSPHESNKKNWYSQKYSLIGMVIILLILFVICCFEKGFIRNPLLLPGVLFAFMFFDFLTFLINYHICLSQKKENSEPLKYYPNLKIWGMGFILGLTVFIFSYFEPLKDILLGKKHTLVDKSEIVMVKDIKILDCKVTSMELIQQIAILLFFLAVLGIILAALVKIVKDE